MPDIELPNPEDVEEQRQKVFTRRVALTVAVYAVVLAVTSLGGSNAAKDMMHAQLEASNQWAYYQAKVIRENLYLIECQRLELELAKEGLVPSSEARQKAEALLATSQETEQRYRREKKQIEDEAKKYVAERDLNRKKDPYFDYAEVLLQIAIVSASIAMLGNSRPMFVLSLVLAMLGALLSANAFAGVPVPLPFLGS